MNVRILKALQTGGCAALIEGRDWGVWRKRDLRMRPVGKLDVGDVQALRASGKLKLLGSGAVEKLVWSGARGDLNITPPSAEALLKDERLEHSGAALLDRVIASYDDERMQRRIAQAATDYAEDFERSASGGRISGMNWSAITAGVRIEGGKPKDRHASSLTEIGASERMVKIADTLGAFKQKFLHRLVIERATRHAVAQSLSLSVARAETCAASVLEELADVYDQSIKRPERAMMRSV